MKVIESYIINVDKLRYRLKVRQLELMDNPVVDNPGAGQSNLPSDPVNREVTMYLKDDYYNNLSKTIKAIDDVYDKSNDDVKEIFKLKYWDPQVDVETWDDIAQRFHCSRTTILRVRAKYLRDIANRIDYINSDF